MGKARDRARAKKGAVHRSGKAIVLTPCSVPGCKGTYLAEEGRAALCPECMLFVSRYLWCQVNIKVVPKETASGLITPGSAEFVALIKGM